MTCQPHVELNRLNLMDLLINGRTDSVIRYNVKE